jgi:ribosomal protein S18 acetylase RimI-like enzyme
MNTGKDQFICSEYEYSVNSRDIKEIINIYKLTFSCPPYTLTDFEIDAFTKSLNENSTNTDSKVLVVRKRSESKILAFAYGYTCKCEGYFWSYVSKCFYNTPSQEMWLTNTDFQYLAEFCVLPAYQRIGIGGIMLVEWVLKMSANTCFLFVEKDASKAIRFYLKNDWHILGENYNEKNKRLYLLMGLRTPKK